MKQIFAILSCILFSFTLFGCNGNKALSQHDALTIEDDYRIVYDAQADAMTRAAVNALCSALQARDLDLKVVDDREPEQAKEILVGTTNRIAAEQKTATLLGIDGAKLLIGAADSELLYMFVQHICEKWLAETARPVVLDQERYIALNEWKAPPRISILSQNVRYADDGNGNDIVDRQIRLQQLIAETSPDLIGTQEVTDQWYGILEACYRDKYVILGASRDGYEANTGEWNAILVRQDRFDILDSDTFWLTDTPEFPSQTEGAICRRICTWAKLRDKLSGRTFIYANTHLDHSNEDVRWAQAEVLIRQLVALKETLPLFLTGDFNTQSNTASYQMINGVFANARQTAVIDTSAVDYTFHAYGRYESEIDFCFYDMEKAVGLQTGIQSQAYGGYVSDHYGVFSEFYLK